MSKLKVLLLIFILILLAGNVYLGIQCFLYKSELDQVQKSIVAQQINQKDLSFAKLLTEKVLLGESSVSFDDRLKLENAVRDINDPEIFAQWQKFTSSKSGAETQQTIGALFEMLLNKISF
ncbi:MAG: hypothetical protein NT026_00565 [Candidatus Staskawiczbacteria bacterium]|nr:hypothetical protein [Candidatus Staskawiczbacteria bacterium]